jgi:hypothetical protein
VATLFGVTARAVREWVGVPRNENGTYDLPALIQYRASRNTGGDVLAGLTPEEQRDPDLVAAYLDNTGVRDQLIYWKMEREKLKHGQESGRLVSREDVRGKLMQLAGRLRDGADILRRGFGNNAAKVLDDTIGELIAEAQREAEEEYRMAQEKKAQAAETVKNIKRRATVEDDDNGE